METQFVKVHTKIISLFDVFTILSVLGFSALSYYYSEPFILAFYSVAVVTFYVLPQNHFYLWEGKNGRIYQSSKKMRTLLGGKRTKIIIPPTDLSVFLQETNEAVFPDGTYLTVRFKLEKKLLYVSPSLLNEETFNLFERLHSYLESKYSSAIELYLDLNKNEEGKYLTGILREMGLSANVTYLSVSYDRLSQQLISFRKP